MNLEKLVLKSPGSLTFFLQGSYVTPESHSVMSAMKRHKAVPVKLIFLSCPFFFPFCLKSLTEGAGSYYHLTHSELVNLLVQREAELERQKAEYERQKLLLAKRETELKKLKPQVKDLEDYIDTLLVRIMEQKPTLLQVRSKFK